MLREQISTPNIQIKCLSDIDANNKYFIDQKNSVFFKKNNQQNKNIIMSIKDLNQYLSKLLYSSGSGTRTHTDISAQRIFLLHLLLHKPT